VRGFCESALPSLLHPPAREAGCATPGEPDCLAVVMSYACGSLSQRDHRSRPNGLLKCTPRRELSCLDNSSSLLI
jgi:hypothetical protein